VFVCRPAAKWMFAADAAQRHDQSHLLSHHIQMPLPTLATLVSQVTHARASHAHQLCLSNKLFPEASPAALPSVQQPTFSKLTYMGPRNVICSM
jgi:hypothetical protein